MCELKLSSPRDIRRSFYEIWNEYGNRRPDLFFEWKKKRDAIEMTDEQRARYNLLADKVRAVLNQDEFDELQFLILLRREELEQQM